MRPCFFPFVFVLLFSILAEGHVAAQSSYRVHTWKSFEGGVMPEQIFYGHFADETTANVVRVAQNPNFPTAVTSGAAQLEIGNYALFWKPTPGRNHLSIFSPDGLDRTRLGADGAALYQADVYLPEPGVPLPSISLLAQVLTAEGKTNYKFYRFGILEPGSKLFFSFGNDEAKPAIHYQQPIEEFELQRPGWHRFQIIFRGREEIYCAIDGRFTSFSPIPEPTHTHLNAGIMVTSTTFDHVALTDNLSIQWTPEASALPLSPWTQEGISLTAPNSTPLESGQSVVWLQDPQQAWLNATRQNRPMLVMFYIPNIAPYQYAKSTVPNNEQAYDAFNKYVLLKLDANQLTGGHLAEKFDVFRLPTILKMGPDGQITDRLVIIQGQTKWPDIEKFLAL